MEAVSMVLVVLLGALASFGLCRAAFFTVAPRTVAVVQRLGVARR